MTKYEEGLSHRFVRYMTSSVFVSQFALVVSPARTRVPQVLGGRNHLQVSLWHPWPRRGLFADHTTRVCIDRIFSTSAVSSSQQNADDQQDDQDES